MIYMSIENITSYTDCGAITVCYESALCSVKFISVLDQVILIMVSRDYLCQGQLLILFINQLFLILCTGIKHDVIAR